MNRSPSEFEEVSSLTTRTLGDEASGTVDTGGVELNELEILEGKTSTGNHGHTVTSARVGRGGGEVGHVRNHRWQGRSCGRGSGGWYRPPCSRQ